jgi:tetratricopeptide (TPR) repeat protein
MPDGAPHPNAVGGAGQSDEALRQAAFALDRQQPQDAERIAGELLKRNPGNIRALVILGRALLMQGRAGDAVAPLESAARSQHDPEIDTQLAIALQQVGRREDALSRLKRACKRQPPHALAFHELGYLLATMERYDEAIAALQRAIELSPMAPQPLIQLGYVFLNCRRCAEAKAVFTRGLQIIPDSPAALFGMAKAHHGLGEYRPAADYYRLCLRSGPDSETTWINLGHCLLASGEREAGYECFRSAARGDPQRGGRALSSLATSSRGRFWLRPSRALQFLGVNKP